MTARVPNIHTLFHQWMILEGYSDPALAKEIGCSRQTIWRMRSGKKILKVYATLIRALHPDCPLPADGQVEVFERALPAPTPKHRPRLVKLAARKAQQAWRRDHSVGAKRLQAKRSRPSHKIRLPGFPKAAAVDETPRAPTPPDSPDA